MCAPVYTHAHVCRHTCTCVYLLIRPKVNFKCPSLGAVHVVFEKRCLIGLEPTEWNELAGHPVGPMSLPVKN